MSAFLFAFLAVLLASLGGRDQLLVAQVTTVQGPRPGVLVTGALVACAAAAVWAWLATMAELRLPANARLVFAGIALVLAGGEALLLRAKPPPAEPTRSLFAFALVIAAIEVTDAARFLVLALALVMVAPVPVALGGAAGGALGLAIAWSAPELAGAPWLRWVRRGAGLVLLVAGLVVAARGIG